MDTATLDRIRRLWEGDAIADPCLIWPRIVASSDNLAQVVQEIAAVGEIDSAFQVEPETLAEMRSAANPKE